MPVGSLIGAFIGWVYGSMKGMGFLGAMAGAALFAGLVFVTNRFMGWAGGMRSDYRILGDGNTDTSTWVSVGPGDGGADGGKGDEEDGGEGPDRGRSS